MLSDHVINRRTHPRVVILDADFNVVLADEADATLDTSVLHSARNAILDGLESVDVFLPNAQHYVVRVARLLGPPSMSYALFVEPRGFRRPLIDAFDRFGLTPREVEVLSLIVDGASNREIADALSIVENTVQDYVRRLCTKSGSRRRGDLLAKVFGVGDALDGPGPA